MWTSQLQHDLGNWWGGGFVTPGSDRVISVAILAQEHRCFKTLFVFLTFLSVNSIAQTNSSGYKAKNTDTEQKIQERGKNYNVNFDQVRQTFD